MGLGDVTSTYEGTFIASDAALLTELDTLTTGAATAGADIKSIVMVPTGGGDSRVHVFTITRAAA